MHFTENKGNASAAVIKTPFLIEDILDRNSMKAASKIHFRSHAENSANQNMRNNGAIEQAVNGHSEKNLRNNNEIPANDEEYRKLLQNDR